MVDQTVRTRLGSSLSDQDILNWLIEERTKEGWKLSVQTPGGVQFVKPK
jgi:Fe-S cluster assembly ATPase SufC